MTQQSRAELFLLGTTFVWGSTFVVVKAGSEAISPSLYIALRFGIGAFIFFFMLLKQLRSITPTAVRKGVLLGAMLGVGIILQNYGIYQTTASKSAFITGLMVIFTPLAQLVLQRRGPKAGNVLGIIIVTFGLYLLTAPDGSEMNFGDLLVLVSAAIFGIYIVYLDLYTKNENVLHLAFLQVTVTSLTAALIVPLEEFTFDISVPLIISLVYMGIFATVVTTYIQTRYQKDTTPTRAVIIFTIEPVIASVLAYFTLNEVMGLIGVAGAILIITGILISEFLDGLVQKFRSQRSEQGA